jgi:nucleoside-diphosphate-sugar epimerase
MRHILVTGGTGYLGSALVPELAKHHPVRVFCQMNFGNPIADTPNVEFIDGDIRDGSAMEKALVGITDVVHLAGIVTSELVDMNPAFALEVNVGATRQLCSLAVSADVKRFIYASSSSIYGYSDRDKTEDMHPNPNDHYAQTKLDAERIVMGFASQMIVGAIRMATLMGPSPRMRLDTIVNVFSKQAWYDTGITVWGGDQYRSNVHVDDAVRAYLMLLVSDPTLVQGMAYNVNQASLSARDIAMEVSNAFTDFTGTFPAIDIDKTKSDHRSYRLDAALIGRALGWKPTKTIKDAALDNFKWFKDGHVKDPNSDLHYNTRRMADVVKG